MDPSIPPQPIPDEDTQRFWDATARGDLELCRCRECRRWLQPPLERCSACGGATAFEPVQGTGEVHSYLVVRRPSVPGYLEDLPYVVALVELDEQPGLRLPGRMIDVDPEKVQIGDRVEAEIVDLPGGDYRVPVFRPVSSAG